MSRILFVCSANKDRSKTADDFFSAAYPDLKFDSCGTNHKLCQQEGTTPVSQEQLDWADLIIVMEEKHRRLILDCSATKIGNKVKVLGIQDRYKYYQPELLELLSEKVSPFLDLS